MNIFFKFTIITFLLLLSSGQSIGQNKRESLLKSEKRMVEGNIEPEKILYPGDSTIAVTYYKLDLTLTYSPDYLKGAVTVNAKSSTLGLKTFFLDLTDILKVDSVIKNGKPLQVNHSNNKLYIILDTVFNTGSSFSVIIYYEGVPVEGGFGGFVFDSTSNSGSHSFWTLSEPYEASSWWPCKDTRQIKPIHPMSGSLAAKN